MVEEKKPYSIKDNEYLRSILNNQFSTFENDWVQNLNWVLPHRGTYLRGKTKGKRENHHIVDLTHIIAHRSFVAGFQEGNTSTTRPWFRLKHPDEDLNNYEPVKAYLQKLRNRALAIGTSSNLYLALAEAYGDYAAVNTACIYIDERKEGPNFVVLEPGTYRLMNDYTGLANVLVREIPMTVKQIVEEFVKSKDDYKNKISDTVRNMYEAGNYNEEIIVVEVCRENHLFTIDKPMGGINRKWCSMYYESGKLSSNTRVYTGLSGDYQGPIEDNRFLRISHRSRKPFIAFRSASTPSFAYGQKGPTTDSMGAILSLNKKAMSKDVAIDLMLRPPMQGPASLKRSYMNTNPNSYTALDPHAMAQGGAKQLFQINPAISILNEDINELRGMVKKLFFEDFMLFLTQNPKTRTAAEVNAILGEQQLVIGPTLQQTDYTLNRPLVEFLVDYALFEDDYLPEAPEELAGESVRVDFVSVFAQAQRSADLPSIDRYVQGIANVSAFAPGILDKLNVDLLADTYADRLYIPAGINRSDKDVAARREQAAQEQARQKQLNETIPGLAGAAKDLASVEQINKSLTEAA